jgi:CBS domain-containing protein
MTRETVTATAGTPIGEVADLLAGHRISAVPIVGDDDRLLGVVSAADLLPKVDAGGRATRRRRSAEAAAGTAQEVMTTPPVTIDADASLAEAARTMRRRRVRRLLVTDDAGHLRGVVSRTDLLRPLNRRDAAIRADVAEHLRRVLWIGPVQMQVHVDGGVVTLTGAVGRRSSAAIDTRLATEVPGVVAVVDRIRYEFDDGSLTRSRVGRTHPFSAEPFGPKRPARSAA